MGISNNNKNRLNNCEEENDENYYSEFTDFIERFPPVFKPNSVQRMKLVKVGDPIDCNTTDCNECTYNECNIKKKMKIRNKKIAEWEKEHGRGNK